MMVDLNQINKLKPGDIAIVDIDYKSYNNLILELLKNCNEQKKQAVVLSATKGYGDFTDFLSENKLNKENVCYIDTITRLSGVILKNEPKVMYVGQPSDLTDVSINVAACLDLNKNSIIIIDSLSTFSLYNSANDLIKFIHLLSQKTKKSGAVALLIAVKEDIDQDLIQRLKNYCDAEIDLALTKGSSYFIEP